MSIVAPQLPRPVASYLVRFVARRRAQRVAWFAGFAALLTMVWALAWCLADRALGLDGTIRAGALAVNLVGMIALLGRPVLRLWATPDLPRAAGEVERREPAFRERLRTLASRAAGPVAYAGSGELLSALATEVTAQVAQRRPGELLPWGPSLRPWIGCGLLGLLWGGLAMIPVLDLPRLARRYARPLADVPAAATTRLWITPGDARVQQGGALRVRAVAERLGPSAAVTLRVRPRGAAGQEWTEQPMPSQPDGAFEARVQDVAQDLEYHVTGGDARSETYVAAVLRRPAVISLRVRYAYPAYAQLAPRESVISDGIIEGPVGTEAKVRIEASEPLAAATLAVGVAAVAAAVPTRATELPHVREATLSIRDDQRFEIRLTSAAGVEGAFRGGAIRAVADQKPVVVVVRRAGGDAAGGGGAGADAVPSAQSGRRPVASGERIAIAYHAADDLGLARLDAEVRVVGRGGADVAMAVPIRADARVQTGTAMVGLAPLRVRLGDEIEVRLRAEDRAGQFASSATERLIVTSDQPPPPAPAAVVASPAPVSPTHPVAPAPAPVAPAGYDGALRAYFDAIRARGDAR